jgi:hypothetical protein
MSYWILGITGRTVSRTTVQQLTALELQDVDQRTRCNEYDERVKELFHDEQHVLPVGEYEVHDMWETFQDDADFLNEIEGINSPDIKDEEEEEQETSNKRKQPTAERMIVI